MPGSFPLELYWVVGLGYLLSDVLRLFCVTVPVRSIGYRVRTAMPASVSSSKLVLGLEL